MLLLFASTACSKSSSDTRALDAGLGDGATSEDVVLPAQGGSGTVSGSPDGTAFDTVATAYLLGAPDSPNTTVVYIFSKPVSCADIGSPGWDTRITNGTQFLEMKIFGSAPGTFTAVTTVTPAPGEASVNYTLSTISGTPKEIGASGGTVTLTSMTPTTNAKGSFAVRFDTNTLNGTFDAVFCPQGTEP